MLDICMSMQNMNMLIRNKALGDIETTCSKKFQKRIFSKLKLKPLPLAAVAATTVLHKLRDRFSRLPRINKVELENKSRAKSFNRAESLAKSGFILQLRFAVYPVKLGGYSIVHGVVSPSFQTYKYDVFLKIAHGNSFLDNVCSCVQG